MNATDGPERGMRLFYERGGLTEAPGEDRIRVLLSLARDALRSRRRPLRILDVGCGEGLVSASVSSLAPTASLVGVDWAMRALELARDKGVAPVQAAIDGVALPFASGTFDVVILTEVIEHLVHTDDMVDEIGRVLGESGVFLLSTPNLAAWFNRALLVAGFQPAFSEVSVRRVFGRPGQRKVMGHLRIFTKRALIEFLAGAGFGDIKCMGAGFHGVPRPFRWIDGIFARWTGGASILVVSAKKRPMVGRRL